MNRHFEDALYYLERAGTHAKLGAAEAFEPVEETVRELAGREKEPEPSRVESLVQNAKELEERTEGEVREVFGEVRETLDAHRPSR